jgi:hypothetical protein
MTQLEQLAHQLAGQRNHALNALAEAEVHKQMLQVECTALKEEVAKLQQQLRNYEVEKGA